MLLIAMVAVNLVVVGAEASVVTTFKTTGGKIWQLSLSSTTISNNKCAATAILKQPSGIKFDTLFVDNTLYCSGTTNAIDEVYAYNQASASVTVYASATSTAGYGESSANVGDSTYGYGGTTVYNLTN
jgi:hypothetical protein